MKRLLMLCLLCSGCAPNTFFGAKLDGPYHHHYRNQIQCAWVKGWSVNVNRSVCMCALNDGHYCNRAFIESESVFCIRDIDP